MSDDVVEAMALGGGLVDAMARAAYSAMGFAVPWDALAPGIKALWRRAQLDAIRALHERGGLVLGEMPGGIFTGDDVGMGYALALRDISAAAVKVERV